MAGAGKNDEEKLVKRFTLRFTEAEYEKLEDWSDSAGMTVSEFIRHAVQNDTINLTYTMQATFPDVTNAVKDMGRTMSGIGNNLNQIARWLNGGNSTNEQIRKAVIQMQTDIGAIRREMDGLEKIVNIAFKEFNDGNAEKKGWLNATPERL